MSWPFFVSGFALMRLNINKEISHEDRTPTPNAKHHA